MRSAKGFTLIELLVTLALASILLMAGMPGLQSLLANMSLSLHRDKLVNSMAYARNEAVARLDNISVRSSSGTTTWSNGWTVFVDENGDCALDTADELLKSVDTSSEGIAISATTNAINCVTFNSYGENASSTERVLELTKTNGKAQKVTVSSIGYVSFD